MGNIIGIVGEYNPFHNGHKYHIDESRHILGEDTPVIAVMSGDFVQRGEPAVYSKFARAEAAVRCGADLVIELPLPWCLSSAEGFARGSVGLLGAMGVTHLSFGSELGEIKPLDELAQALLDPTLTFDIKEKLKKEPNMSFPQARQLVIADRLGADASLLETPNNILAVEYIKAIYELGLNIKPVTVRRYGSSHDGEGQTGMRSASELRRMILMGKSVEGEIPKEALEVYMNEEAQGRCAIESKTLEQAILSRIRMVPLSAFVMQQDGADGIGKRLYEAARTESSIEAVLAAAKTRRYALSRLRRMIMCAALGIKEGMNEGIPPYARVLAFNERGQQLLAEINRKNVVPTVTKPADVRNISADCGQVFTLGASAHDMYVLGYKAENERKGTNDWKTGPKIVKNI